MWMWWVWLQSQSLQGSVSYRHLGHSTWYLSECISEDLLTGCFLYLKFQALEGPLVTEAGILHRKRNERALLEIKPCFDLRIWWIHGIILIIIFLYFRFSDYNTIISFRKLRELFKLRGWSQKFLVFMMFFSRSEVLHVLF